MTGLFERIKLITFDLDDTLWPCMPTILKAESKVYAWLKEHAPLITENYSITDLRDHRHFIIQKFPEIAHDLTQQRLISLTQLMEKYDYSSEFALTANAIFRQARNQVDLYEDVLPVLVDLKKHFKLVSLTNGNVQLEYTPLADHFHLNISAVTAGAAKPDPAMFNQAMDFAQVTPEQSLHIGDDPKLDIIIAKELGFKTVWVNRENKSWSNDLVEADKEINNLFELTDKFRAF